MDVTTDWFWEGNVVDTLACFLERNNWTIVSKPDTRSKHHGPDIHAVHGDRTLLIEVKGYPARTYRDPRRAGQLKPTNPTNQAQQWYSHALLKALRLQAKHPKATIALGFPNFPRYRTLFAETAGGLSTLGIAMLIVSGDGHVETWGLKDAS